MGIGWLIIATVLAAAGGVSGVMMMRDDKSGRSAHWWMLLVFGAQLMALRWRGELRGQCPLGDLGEVCLFLAWSLTLFYLVTGTAYRVSLLGVFTAPLVVLLQLIALLPGSFESKVIAVESVDAWKEAHTSLSVLSYGAQPPFSPMKAAQPCPLRPSGQKQIPSSSAFAGSRGMRSKKPESPTTERAEGSRKERGSKKVAQPLEVMFLFSGLRVLRVLSGHFISSAFCSLPLLL